MITMSYGDLLLSILTLCAVAATMAFVFGIARARITLGRFDSLLVRLETLVPEVDRLSREAEDALRSVRELSDTAGEIARDVESVASETRQAALPLLHELAGQAEAARLALRQVMALAVGAKAGLAALARSRS